MKLFVNKMKLVSAVILCWSVSALYGSLRTDLRGTWRNQLNSNMTIRNVDDNSFTGVYHTAVESNTGAASISSNISGMIQDTENGKLIGFNVLWNKGASLTAWVGQCMVCNGQEKIYTTWVLRSYLPVKKRWMTTRINQDTFFRVDSSAHEESNDIVPILSEDTIVQDASDSLSNQAHPNSVSKIMESISGIHGKWVGSSRDSFEVKEMKDHGIFNGIHQSHGENGGFSVGRFDGNQTYAAVGFIASQPTKLRGYTGHIDDPEVPGQILETSWLEHTFHHDCLAPRKFVRFGIDNFSKVDHV